MNIAESLGGIRLIVVPDSDERWQNVEPMTVLGDGRDAYVKASEWPEIREAIIKATEPKP